MTHFFFEALDFFGIGALLFGHLVVEEAQDGVAVVHGGQFGGRVLVDVLGPKVDAVVDEERDAVHVAARRRKVQARVAVMVALLRVASVIKEKKLFLKNRTEIPIT